MQPTINNSMTDPLAKGDTIYINEYASFSRNDIVVAKVDWYEHLIIKRVVGIPGDKIEIRDEITHFAVYVNDTLFYTKEKYGTDETFYKTGSIGYYDNYLNFFEKEEFKDYIETEDETGKSFIYLEDNEYFLMGDNWGHTTDSVEKGPVRKNQITGRVDLIVEVNNKNPFVETWFMLKKIFS